jgi:hypothetical protein
MSDDEREIRKALGTESRATFGDLRRRMEEDRPGGCEEHAAALTAHATGSVEPDAIRHAGACARCRDRADEALDVWRKLSWPDSKALFRDLKPRLLAPRPFRMWRAAAAALLAACGALAIAVPSAAPQTGGPGLAERLKRSGVSLRRVADRGTEPAARTLAAIGTPEAEALLIGMMGRDPDVDALIVSALTGRDLGPVHPADVVRDWRPDLLPALLDSAPPGSASVILPALFIPRLAERATRALERLPRHEAETALTLAGIGATLEEAGEFAERGVAVPAALAAATRSPAHRTRCFWSAVTGDDGVEFLMAAAGTPYLREDAFNFLGLLPDDLVAAACREALRDPSLVAGAARVAVWLKDRSLVPALLRAARQSGVAGLELEEGPLVSAREETVATVCLKAAEELARAD